jgi:hypothetical protein
MLAGGLKPAIPPSWTLARQPVLKFIGKSSRIVRVTGMIASQWSSAENPLREVMANPAREVTAYGFRIFI